MGFFMRRPNLPSFRNVFWPIRLLVSTAANLGSGRSLLSETATMPFSDDATRQIFTYGGCFFAFKTKRSTRSKNALIFQASPYCSSANRFLCGELMRARTRGFLSWFNRSPASCATFRGDTPVVPRVLALTQRHRHKSPCARRPFAEISGSISFSPPEFPFPETVPNFACHFKGSLHDSHWPPIIYKAS
jgi:hypothetical protein